jgi:hypothetical protein
MGHEAGAMSVPAARLTHWTAMALLVAFTMASLVACQSKGAFPRQASTAAQATVPAPSAARTKAPSKPVVGFESEEVDFSTCQKAKASPSAEEDDGDGLIRCALAAGMIAQQDGSACIDVNRLLDDKGESLFSSEMVTPPKGTVFVPDPKFELRRCQRAPYAVFQSGELFPEGTSVKNPCHKKKPLRHTYVVQDFQNNQRHEDVTLDRAKELLAEIARTTACQASER